MSQLLPLRTVAEAKQIFFDALGNFSPDVETIETLNAAGRVTAESIPSKEFLPAFTRSSMDGYAVRAVDTRDAMISSPIQLKLAGELPMGKIPKLVLKPGQAALIHTGGMVPEGADAVVVLEQTHLADGVVEIRKAASSGENLIFKGEDVKPGDHVIPAGKRIRPADVGGLLALGYTRVKVARKPVVAVLSSGDEVIPSDRVPQPGQVRDINSGSLSALVEQAGGEARQYPIIPDKLEQMEAAVKKAFSETDAVILSAGSSASVRDVSAQVISGLGKPGVLVHGINFRPGKPTILAVCYGKPVIGLPGNPISALVIGQFFVLPLLGKLQGLSEDPIPPMIKAVLTVDFNSQVEKEEWVPVQLQQKGDHYEAEPILFKSNLIFQLSKANGLMKILPGESRKDANTEVDVLLY